MFFIVTFHQIVFYSLCFERSWLLIHLMLKLIGTARSDYFAGIIVSIHPMLKLIYSPYSILFFNLLVSIHPMLKLITIALINHTQKLGFNTSHVKVNPHGKCYVVSRQNVSIHPMLKLIGNYKYGISRLPFQYIPC